MSIEGIQIDTAVAKNKYCRSALALKKNIEIDFLTLGAMLSRIQSEQIWEAGWESWDEYSMELKMSSATISRLIRIYEVFHVGYGIPQAKLADAGGYTVLAEYLPLVSKETTKEQVGEWLGEAAELTRSDVRRSIIERKKGVDMTKCKHPNKYVLEVCPDCGDRHRVD